MKDKKVCALILAAGVGSRMGSDVTKQKMLICEKSILCRTLLAFEKCSTVEAVFVVARESELDFVKEEIEIGGILKVRGVIVGGATRDESARLGFAAIEDNYELVAIHDAARCLVTPSLIDKVVLRAAECGAASAVRRINDTVKRIDEDGNIYKTEDRESLRFAETPQVFSVSLYREALDCASVNGISVTDDNMLIESLGRTVAAVESCEENLKITTPKDLEYAEFIITKGDALCESSE